MAKFNAGNKVIVKFVDTDDNPYFKTGDVGTFIEDITGGCAIIDFNDSGNREVFGAGKWCVTLDQIETVIVDSEYFYKPMTKEDFNKFKAGVHNVIYNIVDSDTMTRLGNNEGFNCGLCWLVQNTGGRFAYKFISYLFDTKDQESTYPFGPKGEWTEERMNALALMSVIEFEDLI